MDNKEPNKIEEVPEKKVLHKKREKRVKVQKVKEKKNKTLSTIVPIIIFLILVVGAGVGTICYLNMSGEEGKTTKVDVTKKASAYRMSGNSVEKFDFAFLQQDNTQSNKVYSPLSIKYALAMLSEGADGTTKEQIDAVIGSYKSKKYTNSEHLSLANAAFFRNTFKDHVKADFVNNLINKYNAEVIYDDFSTPNNINNWVSGKTFNLINNLLDDVSTNEFVLVNALAIDMEWNKKIQAVEGKDMYNINYLHEDYSAFIRDVSGNYYEKIKFNGEEKEVQALQFGASINNYDIVEVLGEDNIRKTVGDEYDKWLAEKPCGEDIEYETKEEFLDRYIKEIDSNYGNVSASTDFLFYEDSNVKTFAKNLKTYDGTTLQYVGIMPVKDSLETYVKNINAVKINNIVSNLKDIKLDNFEKGYITKITGYAPLFNFEYEVNLIKSLKDLGITDVFDINKSDLSKISDGSLFIDKAVHKANIEFSNDGIKAAAATAMGGMGSTGCWFEYNYEVPVKVIDLTFDKPYLFLIRDKDSGEVWFTGTVYNPLV